MSQPPEGPDAGQGQPPEAIPERPHYVTPGRIVMLFLAVIGLYVVWPSLIATFSSVTSVVARAAISRTSPTAPGSSTRCPILIGR